MKKLYYLVIILFIISLISTSIILLNEKNSYKESKHIVLENYNEISLKEKYDTYRRMYNNEEIVGTITIPGTNINTLFVQTKDNKYYLSHNLQKEKTKLGAAFMDYRNSFEDRQINIYGHNSNKYDVAFKDLKLYLNNDFTKNNDLVQLENENGIKSYKIVSVKRTKSKEHMILNSNNFINHINKIRKDSLYDNGIEVNETDNILILQTCLLDGSRDYLIILCIGLDNN